MVRHPDASRDLSGITRQDDGPLQIPIFIGDDEGELTALIGMTNLRWPGASGQLPSLPDGQLATPNLTLLL